MSSPRTHPLLLAAALSLFAAPAAGQVPKGRWQAHIAYDSMTIAFPIEFAGDSTSATASFFNGEDRVTSTGVSRLGDSLIFRFDHLATQLRLVLDKGTLRGTYGNPRRSRALEARPYTPATPVASAAPAEGVWYLPHNTSKGEKAWRFVMKQSDAGTSATILRVDGDAGAHIGSFVEGRYLLHHFDGARASQIEVFPAPDSIIVRVRSGRGAARTFVGFRPETAAARGLPEPADFAQHTGIKDPDEPFHFSFPDLAGNTVSNTDAKFADKVVLVNIGGSWCPNCHDEAPFLAQLHRTYRAQGLEIVLLDFEEPDELKDPARLRAFIQRHGVDYTVLLAGQPDELASKIPQATNLNSWPTTFFLARDGTVRRVHAGFAARASGAFHEQLKRDYIETIERLLNEKVSSTHVRD